MSRDGGFADAATSAVLVWDEFWHGATLNVHPRLTERQGMLAAHWASGLLLPRLAFDPTGYVTSGTESLTFGDLDGPNPWGRGLALIVCIDCGHDFHPDSSPHLDRCWQCAERADAEADR